MTTAQSGIYVIANKTDGKCYVGQAANTHKRWRDHSTMLAAGKHHCAHLQRSYVKYGAEAFVFSVIEECGPEVITQREQFWMDFFKPTGLYNTAPAAGSMLGTKHSEETRAKMRLAWESRPPASEETRAKIKAAHSTPEAKAAQRARMKAQFADPAVLAAVVAKRKLKPVSEEHKRKVGQASRDHWQNPEYRKKVIAAREAMWQKPEHRAHMVEVMSKVRTSPDGILKWKEVRASASFGDEFKAKISATLSVKWADPAFKAATLAKRRATLAKNKALKAGLALI